MKIDNIKFESMIDLFDEKYRITVYTGKDTDNPRRYWVTFKSNTRDLVPALSMLCQKLIDEDTEKKEQK